MKKKPRLSAFDRPSKNWSLVDNLKPDLHDKLLRHPFTYIAWVNSHHFMVPPVVYSLSEVWEMSGEIPYWWHVMTCHYPDLSSVSDWLKMCFNQSAALLGLLLLAWVSGVSGEKGKDGSEKGESWRRETPDTDSFTGAFHPHTALFDTIQSKSLSFIELSASVLVLLRFPFFLKPSMRSFRILVMLNLPFLRNYTCFRNCASVRSPTLCL